MVESGRLSTPLAKAQKAFSTDAIVERYPELSGDSVQVGLVWAKFSAVQESLKGVEGSTANLVGRVNAAINLSVIAQKDPKESGEAIGAWADALQAVSREIAKRRKGPAEVVAAISQLQVLRSALRDSLISSVGVKLMEMVDTALQEHRLGLIAVTVSTLSTIGGLRAELDEGTALAQRRGQEEKRASEDLAELNGRCAGLADEVERWLGALPGPVSEAHSNAIADVRQALADRIDPREEITYLEGSLHLGERLSGKGRELTEVVQERDAVEELHRELVSQLSKGQARLQGGSLEARRSGGRLEAFGDGTWASAGE